MKNESFALCLTFHHPLWLQLGTAAERQQPCFPLFPHICQSRRYNILIQLLMHFMCLVSSFLPSNTVLLPSVCSSPFWWILEVFYQITRRDRIIFIPCWYHPSLQSQQCSTQWVTPPATSWIDSAPVCHYRAKNQCVRRMAQPPMSSP